MPPFTTTGSETTKTDATDRGHGNTTTSTGRRIRFRPSIRYYTTLWKYSNTHTSHGPVQSRYNFRLTTSDIGGLDHGHSFADQTTAFKCNVSYGFILRNKITGRHRYYHSSCNCCGRFLNEPSLITNADTFEIFLERIKEPDILKWALSQRPNSDWVVERVTNATIFVNRILQHPIGYVGIVLPHYVKCNKTVITLEKDHYSRQYVHNLCIFRCLGLHLGHDPKTLYAKYTDQPVETFEGVIIDELHKVETMFEVNIIVYKLSETSAQLVRWSLGKYANNMYVNLYQTHPSLIRDIKAYIHSYRCSKCEHSLWKYPALLERHELTCEAGVRHVYSGGVYHNTPSVFQPTFGRRRNHRRRQTESQPLSSDIRLRMLLRRHRSRAADCSSRSVECESGFQRAGARDSTLLCHRRRLRQIGGFYDEWSQYH